VVHGGVEVSVVPNLRRECHRHLGHRDDRRDGTIGCRGGLPQQLRDLRADNKKREKKRITMNISTRKIMIFNIISVK
jgi:hypothetical protein